MWIMLNDCFFSIVAKRHSHRYLLVRARRKGDIEKVFPRATVSFTPENDYAYRATISRPRVGEAMREAICNIDYPNFKASVRDKKLAKAYGAVHSTLAQTYAGDLE